MKTEANKFYAYRITLIAALGGLLFGYDTAVISGTVESLRHFFIDPMGLSSFAANAMEGFVVSSALIGCVIGAVCAGWISQRLGRKKALFTAAALFFIAAIGTAWPEIGYGMPGSGDHTFVYHFVVYRILGGIGVGIASLTSPMYIAEIAPPKKRGSLVAMNQLAIVFGIVFVYFVNYIIARQDSGSGEWLHTVGWRYMFASLCVPAGLFFILLFFAPETPRWLTMTGRADKAEAILTRLIGSREAEAEMAEIKNSFRNEVQVSMKPYYTFMITWLALFAAGYLTLKLCDVPSAFEIAMIGGFFISLFVPIRSYGFAIIITGVLLSAFQQLVGINVVMYYAPEIFKSMGAATDGALLQTIIVGVVSAIFTVIAIMTVDKFGRKPLLITGALVMAFSMIMLGTAFAVDLHPMLKLAFMVTYTAGFAMSWGPVCWVLLAELFPNSVRSAVMSIAVAAQWVSNFLVSWTFPILDRNETLVSCFNHGFSYWVYGVLAILAALFVWKRIPETKGKTLEDIERVWNHDNQ